MAVHGCRALVALVALVSISCVDLAIAASAPVCLVNHQRMLYRVNRTGTGTVEAFPNQPGVIIAMTTVPEGVTVAGCVTGDVIAIDTANRVWRIDHARTADVPHLVQIGSGVGVLTCPP